MPNSSGPEVAEFEDAILAELAGREIGELDGHEGALDGSGVRIFLYGPDADKLYEAILPAVEQARLPAGTTVTRRYGEPGSPEKVVSL